MLAVVRGGGVEDQPRPFDTAEPGVTASQVGQFTAGESHGVVGGVATHVESQIPVPQTALGLRLTTAARWMAQPELAEWVLA